MEAFMHKSHLVGCAIGLVVAVGFVAISGPSVGGLGFVVVALICPLSMIIAMKLLMGSARQGARDHAPHEHSLEGSASVKAERG